MEYKRALNRTTSIEGKKIERKLAQEIKSNHKSFYFYVKSKSRTKIKVSPLKDNSVNVVSDDKEMCEVLNTFFFSSVFTKESNSMNIPEVIQILQGGCDKMLSDIVNEDIVAKKLLILKLNKAPGLDGFIPTLLIETATFMSSPLNIIINTR